MILLYSILLIIVLHELGHLWAAKLFGCKVERFSVGFGKVLWEKEWRGTVYQIALIPLGGFCKLQDELDFSLSSSAFTNLTYIQKVIVSYAGIGMNCWTAIIAYGLFMLTNNPVFAIFGFYSMAIGLSNALPCPCLDGSYPVAFAFEKFWGKEKTYLFWKKINGHFFKWIMVLNILTLPYLIYMIWKGMIL